MQPGIPAHGLARATWRGEISTNWSGRHRASTRSTTVPRHAKAASIRPFERASAATAPATSAHCTRNRWPGYSGVSTGVCMVVATASSQRAPSSPIWSVTRRFAVLLKRSSCWSISSSCSAMRVATGMRVSAAPDSSRRACVNHPPRPSHSARHCGNRSSSACADGGTACTRSRRTIACSNVFKAAT